MKKSRKPILFIGLFYKVHFSCHRHTFLIRLTSPICTFHARASISPLQCIKQLVSHSHPAFSLLSFSFSSFLYLFRQFENKQSSAVMQCNEFCSAFSSLAEIFERTWKMCEKRVPLWSNYQVEFLCIGNFEALRDMWKIDQIDKLKHFSLEHLG